MTVEFQINAVELTPDGIHINYLRPSDVRKNGLVWQHQVLVPHASDYDDEIEDLMVALNALLADVLDDEDRVEAVALEEGPDERDDESD